MSESCGFCCTKIKNISVKFGDTKVLDNVSIHIHCGQLTVIIGRNGAGKTTLLKAILSEVKHEGEIVFNNKKGKEKLKIGYVPQKLNIENSPTSVYDLVASYISNRPVFLFKSKRLYNDIKKLLKEFGAEELIDKRVDSLSGGELQRIKLAIAMMPAPDLLILDEPNAGIDKKGMEAFYKKINQLKQERDLAVIMVSHDLEFTKKYADDVILLDRKILAEGESEKVFASKEFKKVFSNVILEGGEK